MPTSIPQDNDAELAVLGCCLLNRESIEVAVEILDPSYFWKPLNGAIFRAIVALWNSGAPIDWTTVASQMKTDGTWDELVGPLMVSMQVNVPNTTAIYTYAKAVEHAQLSREVMRASQDALNEITAGADPFDVRDGLTKVLFNLGTQEVVQMAQTVPEMQAAKDQVSPTIIDGLLKEDYRLILTARSGTGKSTFSKFIGYCASQGLHPFTRRQIDPIRCLVVDAENPMENILQVMNPLQTTLAKYSLDPDEERFRTWRKPGGINIRNRRDRSDFQREIAMHQPNLVVMGPAYKLGVTRMGGESWEDAAGEWLAVIDDLRTRYHFAVIIEAHTSKSEAMDPQGSAYITQWAEIGLTLKDDDNDPDLFHLGRFRGDRLQGLTWPEQMRKDPDWLFEGVYS